MKTPAPASKGRIYQTLHTLNQGFDQVLSDFTQLENLGFRHDLLRHFRVSAEELRCWANFEVAETLHETELKDWSRYGLRRRQWEKRFQDPNDILIEAERMKDCQHMKVRRLRPSRKPAASRKPSRRKRQA